jgi:hypothetical protein
MYFSTSKIRILLSSIPLAILSLLFIVFTLTSVTSAEGIIEVGLPCQLRVGNSYDNINNNRSHSHAWPYTSFDLQQGDECQDNNIVASISGTIIKYTRDDSAYCKDANGNNIPGVTYPAVNTIMEISGDNGVKVYYYHHNADYTSTINDGHVDAGEKLATIGSIGCSTGPHIHFEVLKDNVRQVYDNWRFIDAGVPSQTAKITSIVHSNKLYQTFADSSRKVQTRYTTDTIEWSDWQSHGESSSNVALASFNFGDGQGEKLVRAFRDLSGNLILGKSTNGVTWTWENQQNNDGTAMKIIGDPELAVAVAPSPSLASKYLYVAAIRDDKKIAVKNVADVTSIGSSAWVTDGMSDDFIDLTAINKGSATWDLVLTASGNGNNKIYTKTFSAGMLPGTSSSWLNLGETETDFTTISHEGVPFQEHKGEDGKIWERRGVGLTAWTETLAPIASSITDVVSYNNVLYETLRGTDGRPKFRETATDSFVGKALEDTNSTFTSLGVPDLTVFVTGGKTYLVHSAIFDLSPDEVGVRTKQLNAATPVWNNWRNSSVKKEAWVIEQGLTSGNVTNVTFNNRFYQFMRGSDGQSIYQRWSPVRADGVFSSGDYWYLLDGQAGSDVTATVFNNRLYLLTRGETGRVFIRSTADGDFVNKTSDENWVEITGLSAAGNPQIATVEGNLYITARKNGTEEMYQLATTNTFSPNVATSVAGNWQQVSGQTSGDLTMAGHNSVLYQIMPGGANSGRIFLRSKPQGQAFSSWQELTGRTTAGNIHAHSFNGKLYLTIRDKADAKSIYMSVYTPTTATSVAQNWTKQLGSTNRDVTMLGFNNRLYQAVQSSAGNSEIFMRSSSDGVFDLSE